LERPRQPERWLPNGVARLLEPFALLWITLALKQGFGFHWGFKVLK
jgi:hypothetical protein